MDQKSEGPEEYYSLLDNFASEVGSTLEDLATHWEDNQNFKDNGRPSSTLSSESANSMDDFGKKYAKPLFFYNPVYSMVYKDATSKQVKRHTLIPLDQLNGSSKHPGEEEGRHRKGSTGKPSKKKNVHRSHGIFSKISAAARRHSHSKQDDSLSFHEESTSSSRKSSQTSLHEISEGDATADAARKSPDQKRSPSSHEKNHRSIVENQTVSSIKKSHKIPPIKSPRNSRIIAEHVEISVVNEQSLTQGVQPVPVPRKRNRSNETTNEKQPGNVSHTSKDSNSSNCEISPAKVNSRLAEVSVLDGAKHSGSTNSIDSQLSTENPPSDQEGTTMADFITEVAMTGEGDTPTAQTETLDKTKNELLAPSGQLKRNRTLRWTGTRKANALMREFTLKHKQPDVASSSDLDSPCQEVEHLTRNPKVQRHIKPIHTDSRSCTPSQQTTSFGMEDEDDMYSTPNDADVSSSESSDVPPTSFTDGKTSLKPVATNLSKRDSFVLLSSLLPPAPKLRRTQSSKVRAYLQKLGTNVNNALGYAVTQFLEQTLKNKEKRPLVLLHDIRSFLTDIKVYLISNPHIGLAKRIQKIINKSSIVDVEGAVDDALDRLVLYPLHDMVYRCLVVDYRKSGQLTIMQDAISIAKNKSLKELGIRSSLIPPDPAALEVIKGHFVQLQRTYSPYFKLKELLAAVTKIYQSTKDLNTDDHSARKIGADDFLPLLVYAIVQCDFIAADIETQYIDGLLDPTLLLGEGGYYLTTLISAIQVVVSIKRKEAALPNISDLQGFLKVGISPSEPNPNKPEADSANQEVVMHKTLHVPPAMTARNLCQMIAKKFKVSLPENYCLHVVVNNVAHPLEPNECPQLVKMDLLTQFPASSFYFCFQRRSLSPKPTTDVTDSTSQSEDSTTVDLASEAETRVAISESDLTSETNTEKELDFSANSAPQNTKPAFEEDNASGMKDQADTGHNHNQQEHLEPTNTFKGDISEDVVPRATLIVTECTSVDEEDSEKHHDRATDDGENNAPEDTGSRKVENEEDAVQEVTLIVTERTSVNEEDSEKHHDGTTDDGENNAPEDTGLQNVENEDYVVQESNLPEDGHSAEVSDSEEVLEEVEYHQSEDYYENPQQSSPEDTKGSSPSLSGDEESSQASNGSADDYPVENEEKSPEDEISTLNSPPMHNEVKPSHVSENTEKSKVSDEVLTTSRVPTITIRNSGRDRYSMRSSKSNSSGSTGYSDISNDDDFLSIGIRRIHKRKSCMAKENVASLTEYFESKKSDSPPL